MTFASRYNKHTQIAARALRQSLKEEFRVASEKRGQTILRYQKWENGVGGQQVRPLLAFHSNLFHLTSEPSTIASVRST